MNKDVKPRKAEELLAKFDGDTTKEAVTLYPEKGTLQRIACDPATYKKDEYYTKIKTEDKIITFYDGPTPIIQLDKTLLHKEILKLKQPMIDKGIDFLTYQKEYSVEINTPLTHNLQVKGNVKGLIFWIDGKALVG